MSDADRQLTEWVERYGRLIRSVVAKVSGRRDADLGDEVVQRVTEALWQQLRREQTIDHPASYLYRCAVRETIRELRRELAADEGALAAVEAAAAGPGSDPEQEARSRELARATAACMDRMQPERARAVRAHLAGYEVAEIMVMHDWPYQRARNLIARGMADLRKLLAERGFHD